MMTKLMDREDQEVCGVVRLIKKSVLWALAKLFGHLIWATYS
jgi:hypothetical protein